MKIFNKTRYLRALLILLPIGIGLTYWGIEGITKSAKDLPYIEGVISDFKLGSKYSELCDCRMETFFIYIKNTPQPYITTISMDIQKLQDNIKMGDYIEIWIWDESNDNHIEQVKINGKLIIPYDRTIGLYTCFLLIGLGLIILCVFYIIKSSEDLFGKKKV